MAQHSSFYSLVRGLGVVDAYHTHPACQIADSIPLTARRAGAPLGWPECRFCQVHWQASEKHCPALQEELSGRQVA